MRLAPFSPSIPVALLGAFVPACGTQDATTLDGGVDASDDTSAPLDAGSAPDATICAGDADACLSGTAQAEEFAAAPTQLKATVYRTFPARGVQEIDSQFVANDRTWAFDGLRPWTHYYVQIAPRFSRDAGFDFDGGSTAALTSVGPLAVPVTPGALVAIRARPVELDVFEEAVGASGAMKVQVASGRVTEVTAGSTVVAIQIEGSSIRMPYDRNRSAYYLQFTTPPAAQTTYQITTSQTLGSSPTTWNLVADTQTLAPSITSPSAGATVSSQPLTVTWSLEPQADYVTVQVFQQNAISGAFALVYVSPQPNADDVDHETVPITLGTGTYLLNVAFVKANCPVTADGCVHASTVVDAQFAVP